MKKLLVVGVIGLFIGLTCAPSINAQRSNDSREYFIEFYSGKRNSIPITIEQLVKVDSIIEEYHLKPSSDKDILLLLDEINEVGIFDNTEYKKIKQYFSYLQELSNKFKNRIQNILQSNTTNRNLLCSVVASLSGYLEYGFIPSIPPVGLLIYIIPFIFIFTEGIYQTISQYIPFQLLGMVIFGYSTIGWLGEFGSVKGIITTSGICGKKTTEGWLRGNIPIVKFGINFINFGICLAITHVALIGFSGFKIPDIIKDEHGWNILGHHLIGFSLLASYKEIIYS
jgi:hypothetical protein